jgi:hypothetical protein
MRYMFMDDMVERHQVFHQYMDWRAAQGHDGPIQGVDYAYTAEEAISWLSQNKYDSIYLDHDLGTDPITGRTVSIYISLNLKPGDVGTICLHSTNIWGAEYMKNDLLATGFTVTVCPWLELNRAMRRQMGKK